MKKVLFTRKLRMSEIMQCVMHGVFPVIKPMIHIQPISINQEAISKIASGDFPYFVFTSKNAVKYFLKTYNKHLPGILFQGIEFIVIGKQTANGLSEFKNKMHVFNFAGENPFADYVSQISQGKPYLYFCSDLASVKWKWQVKHANATILENYKTIATEKKVNMSGIFQVVFMSSSAVNSFFQHNKLKEEVKCYVIGEPTRKALINYHQGEILKPNVAGFEPLIMIL